MNKPEERIKWFKYKFKTLPNFENVFLYLQYNNFFEAPASTKYHGSYPGGLCDHSINVACALYDFTISHDLEWQRPESPWIVGFFHDLCKIDLYNRKEDGTYEHNKDTLFKGHGDKSLMLISSVLLLTEEEAACIRYHMGAFTDKEEWSDYTSAIHKFPNVLFTHTADMVAAHIIEEGERKEICV